MGIDLYSDTNREKILSLVKNHFSLDRESIERFEDHLYNPFIDETYQKMLGEDTLKVYFDIPEEYLEEMDYGWKDFKTLFRTFCEHYKVEYKDFRSNSIRIDKNQFKIEKALMNFYLESPERIKYLEDDLRLNSRNFDDNFYVFRFLDFDANLNEKDSFPFHGRERINVSAYRREISSILKSIGSVSLPKKNKLKVALSLDFTDFFLAATGETWSSCISLESNYCAAFWSGLPGTIVDPNRSILYITDGKKKKYKGIETDRMLSRTFCILDSADRLNPLKYFPSKYISENKLGSITKLPFNKHYFESKHYFFPLFHKNENSCFIFQDNSSFIRGRYLNEIRIVGSGHGFYSFEKNNLIKEGGQIFNYEQGLNGLIMKNKEISSFENDFEVCSSCDVELEHEDDIFDAPNGDPLCERCFMEYYFICEMCGLTNSQGEESDIEEVCVNCFDMHYDYCDECENIHEKAFLNTVAYTGYNLLCDNCLEDFENNKSA